MLMAGYGEVYSDISSQRNKITSSKSKIKQGYINVAKAKKDLRKQKQMIRRQQYTGSSSSVGYQKAKRQMKLQKTRIKKYKQGLELAEQQIQVAEPKLSEYESTIKKYESEGYNVSKKEDGTLSFSKTVQKKVKSGSSTPIVSQVIYYRKAGSNKINKVQTTNYRVKSVVESLENKGNIITKITSMGGSHHDPHTYHYVRETITKTETKPEVTVDTTTINPKYFEGYITPSISSKISNTPSVPTHVLESAQTTNRNTMTSYPQSATKEKTDLGLGVTLGEIQSEQKKRSEPKPALGVLNVFGIPTGKDYKKVEIKGEQLSLSDVYKQYDSPTSKFKIALSNIQGNISEVETDIQEIRDSPNNVEIVFKDPDTGKETIVNKQEAINRLNKTKNDLQNTKSDIQNQKTEWETEITSAKDKAQDLYDEGYRPYKKSGEVEWFKVKPSTSAMEKSENWLKQAKEGDLWASFGLWGANLLSPNFTYEFRKNLTYEKGKDPLDYNTKDIEHYAGSMETLDTSLKKGVPDYVWTVSTSSFAQIGWSAGIGAGIGYGTGVALGRIAYTSPTLAKGFMVGEMAIGTTFISAEAIRVGEVYKKDPELGTAEAISSVAKIGAGFAGYSAGRKVGFARGTRWGYRSEIKKGNLLVGDANTIDPKTNKMKVYELAWNEGKAYRKNLLQREKALWKLERGGLFNVKTKAQHPVDLGKVETMQKQPTGFKRFTFKHLKYFGSKKLLRGNSQMFGSRVEYVQFENLPETTSHDLDNAFSQYARAKDTFEYGQNKFNIKETVADVKQLPRKGELVTPFGGYKQKPIKLYFGKIDGELVIINQDGMSLGESGIRHAHSSLDLAHEGRYKDIDRSNLIMKELYSQGVKTGQIKGFKVQRMEKNLNKYLDLTKTVEQYPKIMDPAKAEMFYTTTDSPSYRDIPYLTYKTITPKSIQTKISKNTFGKIMGTSLGDRPPVTKSTPPTLSSTLVKPKSLILLQPNTFYQRTDTPTIGRSSNVFEMPSKTMHPTNFVRMYINKPSNKFTTTSTGFYPTPSSSLFISPSSSFRSTSISKSVSPSRSISPSVSPSPSLSKSVSPSRSISPSVSPSISLSLSPSRSPSRSPSTSPSISPSVSPSISPSVSPSPSSSSSTSPSPSPSISPSPSPSVKINWSGKPSYRNKLLEPTRKGKGKKSLYSDLLSVTVSQARFGKATHPKLTKKVWKQAKQQNYIDVPTVELSKKSNRKGFGYRSVKWL